MRSPAKSSFAVAAVAAAVALASLACSGCGEVKRPDGGVGLIQEHTRAPEISAQDQDGKVRTLSEFHGRAVVLYFYPKDDTPGCTTEACAFRDAWTKLQATGAQVLGVSMDDVASHAAFATKHKLPFPLLADPSGKIADSYGVKRTLGYESRVTFIIDGNGAIVKVFPDVDPAVHAKDVMAVLEALPKP